MRNSVDIRTSRGLPNQHGIMGATEEGAGLALRFKPGRRLFRGPRSAAELNDEGGLDLPRGAHNHLGAFCNAS